MNNDFIWMHPPRDLSAQLVPAWEALQRQRLGWLHADAPAEVVVLESPAPAAAPTDSLPQDDSPGSEDRPPGSEDRPDAGGDGLNTGVRNAPDSAAGTVAPATADKPQHGRVMRGNGATRK